jgi:hypothetical protein
MGQVQIFKIELTDYASGAHLTLAAGRELGGDFFISFGEFLLPLFPEQASAFAMAVLRLVYRRRHSTPKPGALWRRVVGDSVSPAFRVELGLTDEAHVYVEAAGAKIGRSSALWRCSSPSWLRPSRRMASSRARMAFRAAGCVSARRWRRRDIRFRGCGN